MAGRYKNSILIRSLAVLATAGIVILITASSGASADTLTSTHYRLSPTVGNSFGGAFGNSSYKLVGSGGEAAIGNGSGGSYKLSAGFVGQLPHSISLNVEPAGLVGYWPMNEGSGPTVHDASSNSSNGTISGSPTWVDGKIGKALNFDGSGDYVDAGINPIIGNTAFTLSAWVNTTQVSQYSGAISIGPSTSNQSAYIGTVATAQTGDSNSIGGGFYGYSIGSGVTTTNQWVYVALTYGGGTASLYVDGSLTNTMAAVPALSSGPMRIGRIGTDTSYDFHGAIDNVQIYDRALTADEVAANYDAQSLGFDAGIVIPALQAGASQTVDANVVVTADAPYSLLTHAFSPLTDVSDPNNTIPAISGTVASPVTWSEGTTRGLGFTVLSGPPSSAGTGEPNPACNAGAPSAWGGGTKYAAVPVMPTSFYDRCGYSGGGKDVIGLQYRLDVPAAQASGKYKTNIAYTATMTP